MSTDALPVAEPVEASAAPAAEASAPAQPPAEPELRRPSDEEVSDVLKALLDDRFVEPLLAIRRPEWSRLLTIARVPVRSSNQRLNLEQTLLLIVVGELAARMPGCTAQFREALVSSMGEALRLSIRDVVGAWVEKDLRINRMVALQALDASVLLMVVSDYKAKTVSEVILDVQGGTEIDRQHPLLRINPTVTVSLNVEHMLLAAVQTVDAYRQAKEQEAAEAEAEGAQPAPVEAAADR